MQSSLSLTHSAFESHLRGEENDVESDGLGVTFLVDCLFEETVLTSSLHLVSSARLTPLAAICDLKKLQLSFL